MSVDFVFTIPLRYHAEAVAVSKAAAFAEASAAADRVLSAIERGTKITALYPSLTPHDAIEVRVGLDDISALKAILDANHSHSFPVVSPDTDEVQLDWEDWSWHTMHLLYSFERESVVDHLGKIQ